MGHPAWYDQHGARVQSLLTLRIDQGAVSLQLQEDLGSGMEVGDLPRLKAWHTGSIFSSPSRSGMASCASSASNAASPSWWTCSGVISDIQDKSNYSKFLPLNWACKP